jgi:hypothetical protein
MFQLLPCFDELFLSEAGIQASVTGQLNGDDLAPRADSVGVRTDQCPRRFRRTLHRAIGAHGHATLIGTFP